MHVQITKAPFFSDQTSFFSAVSKRFMSHNSLTLMLQEIEIEVELTANHLGTFVLKVCPNNNPRQEASQECFDR